MYDMSFEEFDNDYYEIMEDLMLYNEQALLEALEDEKFIYECMYEDFGDLEENPFI